MEYLLIDGYNVINAWFDLEKESMEDCRDKLMHILSNYQGYKNINILIVFDSHLVKGGQQRQFPFDNLTIIFTKENETADNYIERFVYMFGATHMIRVVTSDYLEQTMVLSKGGIRVSPREFKEELKTTNRSIETDVSRKHGKTNTIMSNLKPDLLEKLEKFRRSKGKF